MLSDRLIKKLEGIEKCSKGNHKVRRLFDIMVNNPELWVQAYANIYPNSGAVTPGVDGISLDGLSHNRITMLIQKLKEDKYPYQPAKRVYIPKAKGSKRPLGIPSGNDKLLQEVTRILLERVYEPIFSENSHGFRPNRSCHTALEQIRHIWNGSKWLIEFDIKGFFNQLDHQLLLQFLEKRIDDLKFLRVIRRMLKAGYLEDWKFHKTYSGTPQGGIASPILANIYLHELDEFMEKKIKSFSQGKKRARNPEERRMSNQKTALSKQIEHFKALGNEQAAHRLFTQWKTLGEIQRSFSSGKPDDPHFKRLWYCRYADDLVVAVIGSKEEAQQIKSSIIQFIEERLNLECSPQKTRIVHASEGIRFLGYNVLTLTTPRLRKVKQRGRYVLKRSLRDQMDLQVPREKVHQFCHKKNYGSFDQVKGIHRKYLIWQSDLEIISVFNAELRGIANYYALASNVKTELNRLFYIAKMSAVKTLAAKHKSRTGAIYRRFGKEVKVSYKSQGKDKVRKLFTLKDLERKKPSTYGKLGYDTLISSGKEVDQLPQFFKYRSKAELIQRLNARECEYCGTTQGNFEVHHVRKLSQIKKGKHKWQRIMIARQRKTLILCQNCHDLLHAGKLPSYRNQVGRESAVP